MNNLEREAKSRIAAAQEDAVSEIATQTAEKTINAVRKVLVGSLIHNSGGYHK